ncbi:MAG: hypothetical protein RR146_06120 [Lachnospiraceae bacterium]
MGKKIVKLLIMMNIFALVGCASGQTAKDSPAQEKTSVEEKISTEEKTGTDEKTSTEEKTSAEVKKITPLPDDLTIDTLDNCTVSISFETSDVYQNDAKEVVIPMTVYDYERFDMVDIAAMKEGDILVINQEEVLVKTLERNGDVSINGGLDEDGCWLRTYEDGVFWEVGFDDVKSYHEIGEISLPASKDFTFIDSSSLDQPERQLQQDDFLKEMQNIDDNFVEYATTATIEDGLITNITKTYMP